MASPRGEDPLDEAIASEFTSNYDKWFQNAKKMTKDFAS